MGAGFLYLTKPTDMPGVRTELGAMFGTLWVAKMALKLTTRRRSFYCVRDSGRLIHHGWISISFCRHYPVAAGEVVIGPIWTDERERGRGIGTRAVKGAINEEMIRGRRVFFIDTAENNLAAQRLIEKCGFGQPITRYAKS